MIPLRDVIPSRTTPFVTMLLIALNALVFAYQVSLGPGAQEAFIRFFGLIPASFQVATLVTSMFLHGGWLHFLSNMLYLWIFGDNVEDRIGHGRYLVFYLMCGIAAALVQAWSAPNSAIPMVGASGAIAGVMGAYFVLFPRSRVLTLIPLIIVWDVIELPTIYFLGIWFLMQLVAGLGSLTPTGGGIAFWAHVAGFVAGGASIFFFRRPERQRVEWWG
ncbi:MAG: rhomboid family intramembrane serine protease [Vicinamibacterales bacterium]|jgi:membrane associated rhomboid family serine protease|nr:rhomboid family intramembrane serine protease [Acidobacteriota bacterium]MDP7671685.1 rhomboid family intramembrane serine protease [Vicinamibacterales bacterium]HJO39166.1 rhomboid family intramembrane serine protease [Vicinamibacterales bacterium]|tara:strand:- start:29 stop:682 length:654 start_codon:yes stop_codon:yes gene_type:complete